MKSTATTTIAIPLLCILAILALSPRSHAAPRPDDDTFLQQQARVIVGQTFKVLDAHPPSVTPSDERKLALFTLDGLLHDTRYDGGPAFAGYMQLAATRILDKLKQGKPAKGLRIIKLYSHGFIIQTPSVTIAIDTIRGRTQAKGQDILPLIDMKLMGKIMDLCDVLFITHEHGDHAEWDVAKMFTDAGKPVVVPLDFWKNDKPLPLKIMRGGESVAITGEIPLPKTGKTLKVRVYPGYQKDVTNNIYILTTPEGKNIMHTGDLSGKKNVDMFLNGAEKGRVDVMFLNTWSSASVEVAGLIAPRLLFSGHENETRHPLVHREPYWLSLETLQKTKLPFIIMSPGESFEYDK